MGTGWAFALLNAQFTVLCLSNASIDAQCLGQITVTVAQLQGLSLVLDASLSA